MLQVSIQNSCLSWDCSLLGVLARLGLQIVEGQEMKESAKPIVFIIARLESNVKL
jgi:hypothetical protein